VADRKPYEHLTPEQRAAIDTWLRLHRVEPMYTPEDALIEYDPSVGEWRIEQESRDECGVPDRGPSGRLARHVIRRVARALLPWPEMTLTDVVRRHHDGRGPWAVHLRVTEAALEGMREREPQPEPFVWSPRSVPSALMGISFVVDDDLGDDVWQLVDNRTKAVLARGRLVVDPRQPTQYDMDRWAWRASYLMSASMVDSKSLFRIGAVS
jgi:hypothetical protein